VKSYITLARPFTLLPPLFGIISGAVCAWGSAHNPDPSRAVTLSVILTVALGSLCASFLNAASNAINQIYDLEIDRINKPSRPLVTGELTIRQAWVFSWILYALAIVPTWWVVVYPYTTWPAKFFAPLSQHECFFIYIAGMLFTFIYSAPALGRTKKHPIGANLTIAIPRGCLLKVAGWTMVAHATVAEPWYIGAIFMLFLLGAASTKDFSDIEGDRAGGCRTLPIAFGVRKAAYMIAPSFVIPWLLMPLGAHLGILTGNRLALDILGVTLSIWGAYTVWLILELGPQGARRDDPRTRRDATVLIGLLFVVLTWGALMAGLRAGSAHNTFPTMSGHWIPPGLFEQSPWWTNLFENPTTVQFIHRWLAKLLVLGVLLMAWRARRTEAVLAAAMALVQLSLGIATILTGVDIPVATLHQAGAVLLLTFVIVVRHRATPSRASPLSAIVGA